MSSQIINNYITTPTSPNPYIFRKLNNLDKAKLLQKEHNNWTQLYHKTLWGIEAMIDVQKQVKDMMKMAEEMAEEMNTIITEMEETILKASKNNQIMNTTNILGILEDLWSLIQSDMENWVYQVQQMLANELDEYKGWGN